MDGARIMGLSLTLKSEISFKGGKAQRSNFDDDGALRVNAAPAETSARIAPRGDGILLAGVGEPGARPIAPALLNAIYALTGKRIRTLPVGDQRIKT